MAMFILPYQIKTLSPLIMSSDIGDSNIVRSLDYIKGSAVLGLFASDYIRKKRLINAHEDPQFYRWFLQGEISYLNAYLCEKQGDNLIHYWPTPLCLMMKKTDQNRVYNIARNTVKDANRSVGKYCRVSGERIYIISPQKILNFHHYRNDRIRGHSDDGGIFNYEALDKGQFFAGALVGPQSALAEFKEFFGSLIRAHMGRSKNTEYGLVEFSFGEVAIYEPEDCAEIMAAEQQITLSFVSPALFRNDYGLPEVSTDVVRCYLVQAGLSDFEIKQSFVKTVAVESYVSVWKLKRPLELGVAAGSTYVLHFPQGITDNDKNVLREIVENGLGERTHEGFGRVKINWLKQDQYDRAHTATEIVLKPDGRAPALARQLFSSILIQRLREKITLQALEEAQSYKKRLTNNLLGNLELYLESGTIEAFQQKIENKEQWKEALNNCVHKTTNQSLYQRLCESKVPDIPVLVRDELSLATLAKVAEVNIESDKEIADGLYRHYWRTVFQSMRKLNKIDQRQGVGNDGR